VTVLVAGRRGAAQEQFPFEIFGRYLEPLVQQIGMPGLSAAILQNGVVVRRYNYGYADVERKIPARSDTPYPIGGITQAMTGVLHGVCIDRFTTSVFDIDRDIRLLVPDFPVPQTSVRQVLSHSTDGRFKYDPLLFSKLTSVVESTSCLNQPFRRAMAAEILDRFPGGMLRTVPGMDLNRPGSDAARGLFDGATLGRYQAVLNELAVPYKIDSQARSTRSEYPTYGLDAASGMVSTVDDLATFEKQLDKRDGVPFSASTIDKMWSNQAFDLPSGNSTIRVVMQTGLGWFVTNESGARLVWTFGHIPDAASALIVKLPSKNLTLIMLANSGGLAQGYNLENANVTSSPFVKIFLRLFI
jgi:CubicO group peptidase (beta-lactamase class C family)